MYDRDIDRKIEKGEAEGERKAKDMQASFSSEKIQRYEPIYVHKRLSSVVLAVRAQKRCSIQARPITTWIILPLKPIKQSYALYSSEIFLSVKQNALNTELCCEAFWVVFYRFHSFCIIDPVTAFSTGLSSSLNKPVVDTVYILYIYTLSLARKWTKNIVFVLKI